MAYRIEQHVVRGEIDNRVRGRVTGRIWFLGRAEPVVLDLMGNAWRDVAGRRLEFVNPAPEAGLPPGFASRQTGAIGDCTASRKVRVPDIPLDEIGDYYARREKFPWHWGNSLYLEWFSSSNGRVVIESADYQLAFSGESAWEMTVSEEEAQRRENAGAMNAFMERLSDAVDAGGGKMVSPEEDPDFGRPQTEEEAEAMMAESDKLADRLQARLDREGADADFEKILEEELERRMVENELPPLTPEEEAEREKWIEEMNFATEAAAGDPELEAIVSIRHPLAERAADFAQRIMAEIKEHGWIPEGAHREHPVAELMTGAMCASGKLAGALNSREWPPEIEGCAMAIVWLKRARGYFADAQLAGTCCADDSLANPDWLAAVRTEIDAMTEKVEELIAQCREILERGFD